MFYRDHEPAHFHAEYQGQQAKIDFAGEVIAGEITSKTARRLIKDWATKNRVELDANWKNMKAGRTLERIEPLQ